MTETSGSGEVKTEDIILYARLHKIIYEGSKDLNNNIEASPRDKLIDMKLEGVLLYVSDLLVVIEAIKGI